MHTGPYGGGAMGAWTRGHTGLIFADISLTIVCIKMVANNIIQNGKYRTCCTGARLSHFAS